MNYRRILAIGDMHGKFTRLLSLFHKIEFDEQQDFLILLGDYIDRGEENMRCFRWAMEMSEKPNVVALRGNHEQMMFYFYWLGASEGAIWLPNGGKKTRAEFEDWCQKELPEGSTDITKSTAFRSALRFIIERPLYHKMTINGEEYIFVHAGLNPKKPLEEQDEDDLLWIREKFYNGYRGSAHVICGHTPTPFVKRDWYYPIRLPNKITMMDTGSFMDNGKISCIDILSDQIWQSD